MVHCCTKKNGRLCILRPSSDHTFRIYCHYHARFIGGGNCAIIIITRFIVHEVFQYLRHIFLKQKHALVSNNYTWGMPCSISDADLMNYHYQYIDCMQYNSGCFVPLMLTVSVRFLIQYNVYHLKFCQKVISCPFSDTVYHNPTIDK